MTKQQAVKIKDLRKTLNKHGWENTKLNPDVWRHPDRPNVEIVIGIQIGWVSRTADINEPSGYRPEAKGTSSEELEKYLSGKS